MEERLRIGCLWSLLRCCCFQALILAILSSLSPSLNLFKMELNLQMRGEEKQLRALDFSSTFSALQTCLSETSASGTGHWSGRRAPMRTEMTWILFSALPLAYAA